MKLEAINLAVERHIEDPEMETFHLGQARWPNLRKLILGSNNFSYSEWQSVSQGNWPLLEHLEIFDEVIDIDSAEALRDAACGPTPRWPRLSTLKLGKCFQDTFPPFQVLMEGDWNILQALNLWQQSFEIEGIQVLVAASTRLGALTSLSLLDIENIRQGDIAALFSVPWKALIALELGSSMGARTEFPKEAAQELVAAVQKTHLPKLKTLSFSAFLWPIHFFEIFPPNTWDKLENLYFNNCDICMEEVVALSEVAEHLPKLRVLGRLTYYGLNDRPRTTEDRREMEPYGGEEGAVFLLYTPCIRHLVQF